jgi:hypothetical protein
MTFGTVLIVILARHMSVLQKIRQTGWKYSIAILFNRVIPAWLFRMRRFVVYRMQKANTATEECDSPESTAAISAGRCISESQIEAVEQLTYFQRTYSAGNLVAYHAKIDNQLAAGMWAATECFDENELGVRIRLDPKQAWLFAARVSTDFRRRGLYSHLLPSVMKDLDGKGFVDQLVSVNPDNLGSNRIHQRLSRETVGHVLAIRFLKTTICWTRGRIWKEKTISWNSSNSPIDIQMESAV